MNKIKRNPQEHKRVNQFAMEGYLYVQEKRKMLVSFHDWLSFWIEVQSPWVMQIFVILRKKCWDCLLYSGITRLITPTSAGLGKLSGLSNVGKWLGFFLDIKAPTAPQELQEKEVKIIQFTHQFLFFIVVLNLVVQRFSSWGTVISHPEHLALPP